MQSVKVVVVGDDNSGKSSLIFTHATENFPTKPLLDVTDNMVSRMMLDGKPIELGLWDSSGNKDYDQLRPYSYAQTDCFVICFSLASGLSLRNASARWWPELTKHNPGAPIILVGTKSDLKPDFDITTAIPVVPHSMRPLPGPKAEFVDHETSPRKTTRVLSSILACFLFVQRSLVVHQFTGSSKDNLDLLTLLAKTWTDFKQAAILTCNGVIQLSPDVSLFRWVRNGVTLTFLVKNHKVANEPVLEQISHRLYVQFHVMFGGRKSMVTIGELSNEDMMEVVSQSTSGLAHCSSLKEATARVLTFNNTALRSTSSEDRVLLLSEVQFYFGLFLDVTLRGSRSRSSSSHVDEPVLEFRQQLVRLYGEYLTQNWPSTFRLFQPDQVLVTTDRHNSSVKQVLIVAPSEVRPSALIKQLLMQNKGFSNQCYHMGIPSVLETLAVSFAEVGTKHLAKIESVGLSDSYSSVARSVIRFRALIRSVNQTLHAQGLDSPWNQIQNRWIEQQVTILKDWYGMVYKMWTVVGSSCSKTTSYFVSRAKAVLETGYIPVAQDLSYAIDFDLPDELIRRTRVWIGAEDIELLIAPEGKWPELVQSVMGVIYYADFSTSAAPMLKTAMDCFPSRVVVIAQSDFKDDSGCQIVYVHSQDFLSAFQSCLQSDGFKAATSDMPLTVPAAESIVAEAKAVAREIGARSYLECSALTKTGVTEVFNECIRASLNKSMPKKSRSAFGMSSSEGSRKKPVRIDNVIHSFRHEPEAPRAPSPLASSSLAPSSARAPSSHASSLPTPSSPVLHGSVALSNRAPSSHNSSTTIGGNLSSFADCDALMLSAAAIQANSTQSLSRSLAMVNETAAIGSATMKALEQQGDKLRKASQGLEAKPAKAARRNSNAEEEVAMKESLEILISEVDEINGMFKDLQKLTHEQSAQLDTVESMISSSHNHVQLATAELHMAEIYQKKSRKKRIIVCMLCPVWAPFLVAAAGPLFLWWAGKKLKSIHDNKSKVDDVFADIENVFNGLSVLVLLGESPSEPKTHSMGLACCCCFGCSRHATLKFMCYTLPLVLLVYVFITAFAVTVLLPCIFVLLVVRTSKVERKVENFAARQVVLSQESVAKKSVRVMSLLVRAVPMLGLLVVYPLLATLLILPSVPHLARAVIGPQLVLLAVLQVLGTVRGIRSWIEANKEKSEEQTKERVERLQRNIVSKISLPSKNDSFGSRAPLLTLSSSASIKPHFLHSSSSSSFSSDNAQSQPHSSLQQQQQHKLKSEVDEDSGLSSNLKNWIAILSLLIEAVQLAVIAMPDEEASSFGQLSTVLFLDFTKFVPSFIQLEVFRISVYSAIICVLLLISLFCLQLLRELRRFGLLKRQGESSEANLSFFHSFIGAIIYGHGVLRGVSPLVSVAAAFLSDTLFLVIANKLLSPLSCPALVVENNLKCWQGEHALMSTLSLIALSFYVPLSAMVGPLLAQAEVEASRNSESVQVKYVQPLLSVVSISKFLLLLVANFFAQGVDGAMAVCSLVTCSLLALVLLLWTRRTGSTLLAALKNPQFGVLLPVTPPSMLIFRTTVFGVGTWGAVWGLVLAFSGAQELNSDIQLLVLFLGAALVALIGLMWYRAWKRRARNLRENMSLLAGFMLGDTHKTQIHGHLNLQKRGLVLQDGVWGYFF